MAETGLKKIELSKGSTADGFALAVHGGAGVICISRISALTSYHDGLHRALAAGRDVLAISGSALDAVTEAVAALEDDPLFNAGRGSVFTRAGTQEMDASIMDGSGRRAGAVAGICGPRNPVRAARAVMERSPHVLLIGLGALTFCREAGIAFCEPDYFRTEARWRELELALEHSGDAPPQYGTVGAVARDRNGNLAAATSTGGMTEKLPGRVGDTPIIGAGTYADNMTCAISATGHGELFIRHNAAFAIATRIRYAREPLDLAARAIIDDLAAASGLGGVIAVNRAGGLALPFSTAGMYRGYVRDDMPIQTAVFDEPYRSDKRLPQ
jgi:L-asparaginase / beta-aspartyl-peptidase